MTGTTPTTTLITGDTMIDRSDTEATLYRVAISTFTYYPTKQVDEPGYSLDEDLDWCLTPLSALPAETISALRSATERVITDPTADRRSFIATLSDLEST